MVLVEQVVHVLALDGFKIHTSTSLHNVEITILDYIILTLSGPGSCSMPRMEKGLFLAFTSASFQKI